MRKSIDLLSPISSLSLRRRGTPAPLQLRFANYGAARIVPLSGTSQPWRGVLDDHVVAKALDSTLPDYNRSRPRPQGIAIDLTGLSNDAADRKSSPLLVHGKAKKGHGSFVGQGPTSVTPKGWRCTAAQGAELVRDLLAQVRAAGITVRSTVPDRKFSSVVPRDRRDVVLPLHPVLHIRRTFTPSLILPRLPTP